MTPSEILETARTKHRSCPGGPETIGDRFLREASDLGTPRRQPTPRSHRCACVRQPSLSVTEPPLTVPASPQKSARFRWTYLPSVRAVSGAGGALFIIRPASPR